jgi:hypothetical protein
MYRQRGFQPSAVVRCPLCSMRVFAQSKRHFVLSLMPTSGEAGVRGGAGGNRILHGKTRRSNTRSLGAFNRRNVPLSAAAAACRTPKPAHVIGQSSPTNARAGSIPRLVLRLTLCGFCLRRISWSFVACTLYIIPQSVSIGERSHGPASPPSSRRQRCHSCRGVRRGSKTPQDRAAPVRGPPRCRR